MLSLRALGYQAPDSELLEGVLAGGSAQRSIRILGLHGATPTPVQWGERRRFEVDVDWVPANTQIFVEWYVEGIDGEWAVTNRGLPPELTAEDPTGGILLGEDMWLGPVGAQLLQRRATRFRMVAKLKVGGNSDYEATRQSPWMAVRTEVPEGLSILANGIELPVTAPVSLADLTPPGDPVSGGAPAVPAPPEEGIALRGAALEFRPSWVAPPLRAQLHGQTGYVTEWQISPPPPRPASPSFFTDPFSPVSFTPQHTGRHVVSVKIRPAQQLRFGRVQTRAPVLEASLPFRVLSSSELSERGLQALLTRGVTDYAGRLAELDAQIARVDELRSHGSPAMWRLDDEREQLGQMSERLRDLVGSAPTPLPATGPLDHTTSYVAPLPSVMAVPEARSAIPLQTFLRLDKDGNRWRAWLVDSTTQDVVRFEGYGTTEAAAVRAAISDWHARNELPQHGTVRYDVTILGERIAGNFSTSAGRKTFWEWFDRILFGLQAVVALALLVAPDPSLLTKGAALALLTVGILRGVHRLYTSLSLGRPALDQNHVLEAIGIVLAAVGLGGGVAMARAGATSLAREALSARAMTQFAVGRGMVLTAAAGDVGTFVWVAHSGMAQMRAIAADASLPQAERERRIEQHMLQLAGQGLLLIGMTSQLFRRGALTPQGTRPAFVEAMGGELRIDPVMRTRMESALRRFGDTEDLSSLEPRALLERYLRLQQARGAVVDEVGARAATRGRGIYDEAVEGTQTVATVERSARPLTGAFEGEGFRLENLRAETNHLTADLVVEVPPSGSAAAQTVTVRVHIEVVPRVDAGGAHGAESGMARMALAGDHAAGFRLNIELDSRIVDAADVRHHLRHELREGGDIVRRLTRDPTADVAPQQRAGVFEPGASTDVTSHARAAAYEFRDLLGEAGPAIRAWEQARARAESAGGVPVPESVRLAGERAFRRLDAALDAMGFADPANRASKRSALLDTLGAPEGSPLASYVDGYAARVTGRVQRHAALNALDPPARAQLATDLGSDLHAHLLARAPAGAISPLSRLLGRNDPGNVIRNLARQALTQHRSGRLTDPALVELLTLLDTLTASHREALLSGTAAADLEVILRTSGPEATLAGTSRVAATVVEGATGVRPDGSSVGAYGPLRDASQGTGLQANHLNQNAAYRDHIPPSRGMAHTLQGNAFTQPNTPHWRFHNSLEGFWNQFRRGGAREGQRPTNAEYGRAMEQALRAAGLSEGEVQFLSQLARGQRLRYGLGDEQLVPRIPGRLGQRQPP